jgi:hypothetical protein
MPGSIAVGVVDLRETKAPLDATVLFDLQVCIADPDQAAPRAPFARQVGASAAGAPRLRQQLNSEI